MNFPECNAKKMWYYLKSSNLIGAVWRTWWKLHPLEDGNSVLTVWDYDVCQGFLQLIITGSQKKSRYNLEEGLEKFLIVPEHTQYLACLHRRTSDVVNGLIYDRHLSAAQTVFELDDQSLFPFRVRAVADILKNQNKTNKENLRSE